MKILALMQLNGLHDILFLVAVFGLVAISYWIWQDIPRHEVRMGVTAQEMVKEKCHGMIWVTAADGGIVKRPFHVDKPHKLQKPSYKTVADMFWQVGKMGMMPHTLEIMVDPVITYVYRYGHHEPLVIRRYRGNVELNTDDFMLPA